MAVAELRAVLQLKMNEFKAGVAQAQQQMGNLANNVRDNMRNNNTATRSFSENMTNMGNGMVKTGDKIASVGKGITKNISAPLMAVGGVAFKTGLQYEQSMAEVKAITGATGKDFDSLGKLAREMGSKTRFSASESAEAMKYMGMAGWDTQQIMAGLPSVLNLAVASGEDLGTTSDIVTDALTAFGMSAKETGRFTDVLAAASVNSNTNVSMLGESFKYVAPLAGAMGYTAEDTATALGLMANAGIKGSQAGTSLKTMLTNLQKPTAQQSKLMKQMGIEMTNADGSTKSLGEVMDMLRDKFSGLTPEQQAQASATLFGKEAMSGSLAIINASTKDYDKLSGAIANSKGETKKMADTMDDTSRGSFLAMKSALEEVGIIIFENLKPAFDAVTKVVTTLAQGFGKLPKPVQQFIVVSGGLLAVLGPLVFIFGKVVSSAGKVFIALGNIPSVVTKVGGAFTKLKGVASTAWGAISGVVSLKALAIVGAIGLIIFIGYQIYKHWDEIKEFFTKTWTAISDTAKKVWGNIKKTVTGAWDGVKENAGTTWDGITTTISDKWTAFKDHTREFWGGVGYQLKDIWDGTKEIASKSWTGVSDAIKKVWEPFGNWLSEFWSGTKEKLSGIWDGIKGVASKAWEGIKKVIEVPMSLISSILEGIFLTVKMGLGIAWDGIKILAQKAWEGISKAIIEPFNKVKDAVVTKAQEIGTAIGEKWDAIKTATSEKWGQVSKSVGDAMNSAWQATTTKAQEIATSIGQKWDQVKQATSEKWNQVKQSATEKMNQLKTAVTPIVDGIKNTVSQKWDQLKTATTQKWEQIKQASTQKFNEAKSKITATAGQIHQGVSQKWDQLKSSTSQKWGNIKDSMVNNMNKAKAGVSKALESIKGFFNNLKLKIPAPKMPKLPHFSLKKSTATVFGKSYEYPSGFNVKWYQTGGIATGASVIGVGENGDEAIVPLSNKKRMKPFASAVSNMMKQDFAQNTDDINSGNGDILITGNTFTVREEADIQKIAVELERLRRYQQRSTGQRKITGRV